MVAFAVCFEIAAPGPGEGRFSVCAWSGWFEKAVFFNYMIYTHWLLSVSVLDKEAAWAATEIGKSTFRRAPGNSRRKAYVR